MRSLPRLVTGVCITLSLGLLAAASLRPAAAPRAAAPGALPCVIVQEVETDAVQAYAMWIGEVNKTIAAKFQLDTYRHVMLGESAGDDSGVVFAVTRGESFAALQAQEAAFEKEAALLDARLHMREIRKLGANVSYKAVRFDGVNPQAAVLNTKAVLSDEAAYLTALDGLRGLLDAHALKDVKINCYRVAAGRTEWSHLISLNCPSRERRAALMDALGGEAWAQDWINSINKIRTVVGNGTYRDITPVAATK